MLQSRNVNKENAFAVPPKTPAAKGLNFGTKTPFGDENVRAPMTLKGGAKFNSDAFITPIGPRRIPLGVQNTNVRKLAPPSTGKPQQSRLSSAKRRTPKQASPEVFKDVNQQLSQKLEQAQIAEEEVDIPDVEYMPPRGPDIPWEPENYSPVNWSALRNYRPSVSAYMDRLDDQGRTYIEREDAELFKDPVFEELPVGPEVEVEKVVAEKKEVKTVERKRSTRNTGGVPSYLMPTAAARARQVKHNASAGESTRRAVLSTATRKPIVSSRPASLTTSRMTRPTQPKYEPLFAGMKLDVYESDEDDTFQIEV
ncbi:hypothetical protein YB2330_003297 [Saitoella coloradoensis]